MHFVIGLKLKCQTCYSCFHRVSVRNVMLPSWNFRSRGFHNLGFPYFTIILSFVHIFSGSKDKFRWKRKKDELPTFHLLYVTLRHQLMHFNYISIERCMSIGDEKKKKTVDSGIKFTNC